MPYKKRQTLNKIECRPKRFQSDDFPKPKAVCNSKCLYWWECKKFISKLKEISPPFEPKSKENGVWKKLDKAMEEEVK